MSSILLTNIHMTQFQGSEIVTLELAEEYKKQGWDVTIWSPKPGIPLVRGCDFEIRTTRPERLEEFDIIWFHHQMIQNYIPPRGQVVVANHMSMYVDIEKPKYNPHHVTHILANSAETRADMHIDYRIRCELFQNPAPSSWEHQSDVSQVNDYDVLFISNHPPKELEQARNKFKSKSMGMGLGLSYNRLQYIDLHKIKFVVCNGKTVQYALRAGVPVFCYDQFGGPGWLNETNFQKAEWHNFSGRGFGTHFNPKEKTMSRNTNNFSSILDPEKAQVLPCPDRFKLELRLKELKLI